MRPAANPSVKRKGATVPYTSLNGHMFSYLSNAGKLALRLPPAEREAFLKKYKSRLCEAYGKVQPEYVEVPDALLASTRELKKFFDCKLRIRRLPQTEAHHQKEEGVTLQRPRRRR